MNDGATRRWGRAAIVFAVVLVGLGAAVRIAPAPYGAALRVVASVLWSSGVGDATVRFEANRGADASRWDSQLVVTRRASNRTATLPVSMRVHGAEPTVLLIALVVAAPVSRRRRLRALAWGVPLVTLFALVRLSLVVWRTVSLPGEMDVLHLSGASAWWLEFGVRTLKESSLTRLVVPALIAAAVLSGRVRNAESPGRPPETSG